MIIYRIDPIETLKQHGYTSYKIRKNKIFGEKTLQKMRNREPLSFHEIDIYCSITGLNIGDIFTYKSDEDITE